MARLTREELRELKIKAIGELRSIDVKSYRLNRADDRLNIYCYECINNPDGHNLYELLAVKRFFRLLDKYIFKTTEVQAFIYFYEHLKFSGTSGRRSYKMTPVQVFQFASILGFWITEKKRLTRDALLFVPRKFSKTTSVASLAVNDLLFGDANAQSYVAANSYKQAKICFDEIRDILKCLDKKLRHFKINREIVYNKRRGKSSFAQCLSADADKLDGLNASLVIVDEYSQADSAELKNVLTSSMGVRLNPLTVTITTASEKTEAPFVDMLESYMAILREDIENDSVFAHIFQPDVDDEEDDPRTWRKVQPHLGITVQEDFYEIEYDKAKLTSQDMLTFRTKLLNIFAKDEAKQWFTYKEVDDLLKDIDIDQVGTQYPCMCAVDLSVCDDFSAVSYMVYNPNSRTFHCHNDYYLPRGVLREHPNKELYLKWAEQGHLILLDGEVIDYDAIAFDIIRRSKNLNIYQLGYDSYKSLEFVNIMQAANLGLELKAVGQTYGSFTSPVETMEILIKTKKITFNRNPINPYCFSNAVIDEDRNENRKPIKSSQNNKIDGAITTTMCAKLFNEFV